MPTAVQDKWVFETFAVHPATFPAKPGAAPPTQEPVKAASGTAVAANAKAANGSAGPPAGVAGAVPATGVPSGDTVRSLSIPSLPSIPDVPDPGITATITVVNNSAHSRELVSTHLENPKGSGFDNSPPDGIDKDDGPVEIVVTNNFPFLTGVGGSMIYKIAGDEQNTVLFMQWERGRVPKRAVKAEVRPENKAKYHLHGGFKGDAFTFTFKSKDGADPKPPAPAQQTNDSCAITVTNNTKFALTLAHQGHDRGDFMGIPARTVPPGGAVNVISVKTPNAKPGNEGCKGFLVYEVAGAAESAPPAATWRVEWDNPEGAKNTAQATLDPQSAGFSSLEQIGQGDENVPVAFTLSGGPKPAVTPVDPVDPVDPVEPVDPNTPPAAPPGDKDPTLRLGDSSQDGWVEYLQQLLDIKETGNFDPATRDAVIAFQKKNKLKVDGVVGNQTWAALRHGPKQDVGTDGRAPHSFVETGAKARFYTEDTLPMDGHDGHLYIMVTSVGDTDIAGGKVTVIVTPPGGKPMKTKTVIGPRVEKRPNDEGALHNVVIKDYRKRFPSPDPKADGNEYVVEAILDQSLGGDHLKPTKIVGAVPTDLAK